MAGNGGLLFGFVTVVRYPAEAFGPAVNLRLLAMLAYAVTVVVLVQILLDLVPLKLAAPAVLGKPFHAAASGERASSTVSAQFGWKQPYK